VELTLATGISSLLLLAAASLTVHTARSYAAISNYVELDQDSRYALDLLTRIARQADGVMSFSDHQITLSYELQQVQFAYSPEAKTLTFVNTNNTSKVLLNDCTFLKFDVFQRNCIGGTYDQHATTLTNSEAKLVRVAWVCSRALINNLLNTESVQSAKIVFRNQ